MSDERSLVILGGSSAFLPTLATALADAASDLPPLRVALFGRNRAKLSLVADACQRVAQRAEASHQYLASDDLASLLRDRADIVLNQIRVGGWDGRHHDETFPLRWGYPGDETIGLGGLASGLRSWPVVRELAETVREHRPEAWFVNLTNPMGILVRGLSDIQGLRVFGLCELPEVTVRLACRQIGLDSDRVEASYMGANHQGFFVSLHDGERDRLPDVLDDWKDPYPVEIDVMREWRAIPLSYMRLYFHRERECRILLERQHSRGAELDQLSRDLLEAYSRGDEGLDEAMSRLSKRSMPWNGLAVVPAIRALLGGGPAELYVTAPRELDGLRGQRVTEARCLVDGEGPRDVRPVWPDGFPAERLSGFLDEVLRFEEASFEAARNPKPSTVQAALREHPWRIPHDVAIAMTESVLRYPTQR